MPAASLPHPVIAMDGPAASGKSSVARRIAAELGFAYVNSGLMYRAVAWAVHEAQVNVGDELAVGQFFEGLNCDFSMTDGQCLLRVNGSDPSPFLESPEVNATVSSVARLPQIRQRLVHFQRECANSGPLVMEGRDIGTVVFPETPFKFYIDAAEEVRAARRATQGLDDNVANRDKLDSTRKSSPLIAAPDAVRIDTTTLTLEEVVALVLAQLKLKGLF